MDKEGNSPAGNLNKNIIASQTLPLGYSLGQEESDEEKVLKEISKILAAAKRRGPVIIGVAAIVTAGLLFKISQGPPTFIGGFQLLVEPVTTAESRLQALLSETEGNQRATFNGRDFNLDYVTQIKVLQSPKVTSRFTEEIKEKYPDFNPNDINVKRPFEEDQGTRIIEVTFKDESEEKVKFVLEKIAEGYLKYSLEDRQTNLRQGIEFIKEQIPKLQTRVDVLQTQLENLRKNYDLMNPEFSSNKLTDKLYTLNMRQVEIEVELAAALSVYKTKKKLLEESNYLAVFAGEGEIYGPVVAKIQNLEVELAEALSRLAAEHPTLISLREQQEKLQRKAYIQAQSIVEKHEGKIESLQEQKNALEVGKKEIKEVLEVLPSVARQYSNLERELKVATESLNEKLVKLDRLQVDAAQQDVSWELIAPPFVAQGAKTGKKAMVLTAVGGLILGMGAGLVLEIFNNVFHDPEALEEDTKLPLLATIPFAKELKKSRGGLQGVRKILLPLTSVVSNEGKIGTAVVEKKLSGSYNSSPVWEAFRSLYTNIRLLNDDMPLHSLVVGAACPGDGKSTVALNLAQTAAAMGQRVLLVDADLRNPKIHKKLDLPNLRGLSNAISSDLSLNDAIQRSPLDENLFILTAGSIPPDPVKLLSSKKAQYLMEQFEAFFDLVIYDTPPVVNLADASLIAARTDGAILVVGLEKTDRSLVMKALDGFNLSGGSVLGVVANRVKS